MKSSRVSSPPSHVLFLFNLGVCLPLPELQHLSLPMLVRLFVDVDMLLFSGAGSSRSTRVGHGHATVAVKVDFPVDKGFCNILRSKTSFVSLHCCWKCPFFSPFRFHDSGECRVPESTRLVPFKNVDVLPVLRSSSLCFVCSLSITITAACEGRVQDRTHYA